MQAPASNADRTRAAVTIGGAVLLLLLVAAWRLLAGPTFGWPDDPAARDLRLDRLLAGSVAGGGLAVAGVLLQSLLRNPLASPDLLGVSAGASFAAMLSVAIGYWSAGQIQPQSLAQGPAALAGAFAAMGLVYALGSRRGLIDPTSMILIGVIVAVIAGAGIVTVQHLLPSRGQLTGRWLVGAIDPEIEAIDVALPAALLLGATMWAAISGRAFDAMALGEDDAAASGVRLGAVRSGQFIAAGVLTAASVWLAGPLGFVGLVAPHLVRLAAGPAHRWLVVGSAIVGAALVVAADAAVASLTLPTGRLPIGVLTSLIGGPVFLWMLLEQRSRN
ncbi:MAG: iron ABC transporter permease [Planctomycetota bacterium]